MTDLDRFLQDPQFARGFAVEGLALTAAVRLGELMEQTNTSRAELARRLGKSRAWITQLLSGESNVTLKTLAEVAFALDAEFELQTRPISRASNRAKRWDAPSLLPSSGGAFEFEHEIAA